MVSLPAAAWAADRFGPRRVALFAVTSFGLAFMSMSTLTSSRLVFYAHWLMLSVTGAGTLPLVWARIIASRFERARGAALGLAMIGSGVTGLTAPVLSNYLIEQIGWRSAYAVLGVLPLVIALPLVFVLFREGDGAGETRRAAPALTGPLLTSNWRFWLIGVAFLLVGAGVSGIIPNLVKLLRSHGFTPAHAAGTASLLGLFVIFGRVACGALLDRVWASGVAAAFFVFAGAACLLLRGPSLDPIAIGVAAAAVGMAAGAEFDVMPYLASRYFGVERVSLALGLLSVFFYFGGAIGPWGFGRLVEVTGGYDKPLVVAAALFIAGGSALMLLGRYPADPSAA
jgi:predicted MFS family arabinose efflux permease